MAGAWSGNPGSHRQVECEIGTQIMAQVLEMDTRVRYPCFKRKGFWGLCRDLCGVFIGACFCSLDLFFDPEFEKHATIHRKAVPKPEYVKLPVWASVPILAVTAWMLVRSIVCVFFQKGVDDARH